MAKFNKSALLQRGFADAPDTPQPRLIVGIDGAEGSGKTELSLSAPGPIGYQSVDIGTEGVVEKHVRAGKEVLLKQYFNPIEGGDLSDPTVLKKLQAKAEDFVEEYEEDYKSLLASGIRSIVWDTAGEYWQILRIARFGKLAKVLPVHYGPVNAEYLSLVKMAYNSNTNLILIHKVKAVWAENAKGNSYKTDEVERSGMSETGYLIQLDLNTWRDEEGYHCTVTKSRGNPELLGETFDEPLNKFPFIASMYYPDTDVSDWE